MKQLEKIQSMKDVNLFDILKFNENSKLIVIEKGKNFVSTMQKIKPCNGRLPEFRRSIYYLNPNNKGFCKKVSKEEIININHQNYNAYF